MSMVNISIVGNLIKPPQQFSFSSGKTKTTLVVAVDAPNRKRDTDGRNDCDFYRVEAWGKLGEIAHKYLAKGSLVGATGRLVLSHWQDREGRDRVTPTVEADQIALPPKPKAGDSSSGESHTNPVAGELHFDGLDNTGDLHAADRQAPDGQAGNAMASQPDRQSNAQASDLTDASLSSPDTASESQSNNESTSIDESLMCDPDEEWTQPDAVVSGRRMRG